MRKILAGFVSWEWVGLLLALPVVMFATGWLSLVLLVIPLYWGARWLVSRRFVPATPYDTAVLALTAMVLVSLYAVFDIALSFPKIAGVVFGIALFYGTVAFNRQRPFHLWYLTSFFLLAGVGMALIGLLGTSWQGPFTVLNRLRQALPPALAYIPGTFQGVINPNQLAGVMNWVSPLAIALAVGTWSGMRRQRPFLWLLLVGTALFTAAMLTASLSRGGILSLGLSLLVMLAIARPWGRWLLAGTVIAGLAVAIYGGLPQLLTGESPGTAVNDLNPASPDNLAASLGFDSRLELWSRALYGLQDFPFTGMSMNGFRRVVHILYPLFLISPDMDIVHAHNHLLQAGLDLGLPGLIAYLALWWVSVGVLWHSWQQARATEDRALIIGLSGSLFGGWSFGLLDAITLGARPGFMWWLLLALVVGVYDRVTAVATSIQP